MSDSQTEKYCYPYARPSVTADAVVWTIRKRRWEILLIQRKSPPFVGKWALPGGFVNPEEPLAVAAARELREETGVVADDWRPVDGFGGPGRDPRGWTVTMAYYTLIPESAAELAVAGDDARAVRWHPMRHLPPLAFDHADVVAAAQSRFAADLLLAPVAALLLPKTFTADELAATYRMLGVKRPVGAAKLMEDLVRMRVIAKRRDGTYRFAAAKRQK
jgi:8-oxo-dGTP diphosphatase